MGTQKFQKMFQKTGFGLLGLLSFGVCTFRRGHVVGGGNSRHFGREHSLLKTRAIMPEESKVTAAACAVADSELPQNYIIEFSGPVSESHITAALHKGAVREINLVVFAP